MADEKIEMLEAQIADLEEQTKVLAEKLERVIGIDCSFGACVFDPEMGDIEERLDEVQRRKATLEQIIQNIESCDTA